MSHISESRMFLAAGGWLVAGSLLISQGRSHAEETKSGDPSREKCQFRVEVHGKVPLLNNFPYLSKWFPNPDSQCAVNLQHECGSADCDLLPGHLLTILPNGDRLAVFSGHDGDAHAKCPVSAAVATKFTCSPGLCVANECEAAVTDRESKLAVHSAHPCARQETVCQVVHRDDDRAKLIADLRAEIAFLVAAREAQNNVIEVRQEYFQQLLELSMDNARLQQEVEHAHRQVELQKENLQLQAESDLLKGASQLAEQRHAMQQQLMQVTVENERLKARMTELEQRTMSASDPARISKKQRIAKRATDVK